MAETGVNAFQAVNLTNTTLDKKQRRMQKRTHVQAAPCSTNDVTVR